MTQMILLEPLLKKQIFMIQEKVMIFQSHLNQLYMIQMILQKQPKKLISMIIEQDLCQLIRPKK